MNTSDENEVSHGYAITRKAIDDALYSDIFVWTFYQTVKHQFFDFLMLVGLRDRLRCPKCTAIGTYKPHGGWCDKATDIWTNFKLKLATDYPNAIYATNRRWICKYCGYNLSTDGEFQCYPNKRTQVWGVEDDNSLQTPKEAVEEIPIGNGKTVWPWRG